MLLLRIHLSLCVLIAFNANGSNEFGPLEGYDRPGSLQDAMNTYGLDKKLASILDKYYRNNFSSQQEWHELKSIRYGGTLLLDGSELRFNAYKKKPHYCKFTVVAVNGGSIEMGYDGKDAWQSNTVTSEPSLTSMPEAEASNFIRDATIGGHLLYPLIEGKEVELLGAAVVGKDRCYEIQVTLPDGQIIRSFLDISDFSELRRVTTNQVSGLEEVITNSDFRKIGSIRIPFHSILSRDGTQVHEIRITQAKANQGTMNWMFTRPKLNSAGTVASVSISALKSRTKTMEPLTEKSLNSTFGTSFITDSFYGISKEGNQSSQIDAILRDAGVPFSNKN
ncbi:MAG: hypothetical protein VXU48_02345 [Verrucomicrobiota bacterium]|nr:hypothetical protein [Verrucomicrobiota bacterium]